MKRLWTNFVQLLRELLQDFSDNDPFGDGWGDG